MGELRNFCKGIYTAPEHVNIGGVEGVIVDPHNEVIPPWDNSINGNPAVVIHIDKHSDMSAGDKTLEWIASRTSIDIQTYASHHLGMASFISAAFYYNLISAVYWVNPRSKDQLTAFGRVVDISIEGGSFVRVVDGVIIWCCSLSFLKRMFRRFRMSS